MTEINENINLSNSTKKAPIENSDDEKKQDETPCDDISNLGVVAIKNKMDRYSLN